MDRSLLTWSVPNMITIWLMMIGLIVIYTIGAQVATGAGWMRKSGDAANNAGGY